jgi:hypothetical protein
MSTFTPPTIQDWPQVLPDSTPLQKRLYGHFQLRTRGVNVFKLSDGSYVQDTATAENSNTSVPYPWNLGTKDGVYGWVHDQQHNITTTIANDPFIVSVYYGGHSYSVDSVETAALTNAGYTVT